MQGEKEVPKEIKRQKQGIINTKEVDTSDRQRSKDKT